MSRTGSLRQLWLICVLMGFSFAAVSMMEPLVPLYSLSLGASPATVGLVVAVAHLLPIGTAVPVGSLTDRWGPRRILFWGAVGSVAGPLLIALIPGFASLLGAQVVLGLSQLCMLLAAQTYVGFLARGEKLESYFGWFTTAVSAGQLLGPPLAGALVDTSGFRWAFLATCAISVVPLALSRYMLPGTGASFGPDGGAAGRAPARAAVANPSGQAAAGPAHAAGPVRAGGSAQATGSTHGEAGSAHAGAAGGGAGRDQAPGGAGSPGPGHWTAVLRNPEFQVALFGSCSVLVAMGVRRAFLPLYLDDLAYSASFIGLVMSLRALASMGVRAGMAGLIRLLGGRGMALVVMTLVTAASIGILGLVRSPALLLFTAVLTGLGMGVTQPLTMVIAADAVPRPQHGLAMGVRLTGNRIAQLVSPLIFGFVVQWGGYSVAFLVAGALLASAGVAINRLRPRLEAPQAAPAGRGAGA